MASRILFLMLLSLAAFGVCEDASSSSSSEGESSEEVLDRYPEDEESYVVSRQKRQSGPEALDLSLDHNRHINVGSLSGSYGRSGPVRSLDLEGSAGGVLWRSEDRRHSLGAGVAGSYRRQSAFGDRVSQSDVGGALGYRYNRKGHALHGGVFVSRQAERFNGHRIGSSRDHGRTLGYSFTSPNERHSFTLEGSRSRHGGSRGRLGYRYRF